MNLHELLSCACHTISTMKVQILLVAGFSTRVDTIEKAKNRDREKETSKS